MIDSIHIITSNLKYYTFPKFCTAKIHMSPLSLSVVYVCLHHFSRPHHFLNCFCSHYLLRVVHSWYSFTVDTLLHFIVAILTTLEPSTAPVYTWPTLTRCLHHRCISLTLVVVTTLVRLKDYDGVSLFHCKQKCYKLKMIY